MCENLNSNVVPFSIGLRMLPAISITSVPSVMDPCPTSNQKSQVALCPCLCNSFNPILPQHDGNTPSARPAGSMLHQQGSACLHLPTQAPPPPGRMRCNGWDDDCMHRHRCRRGQKEQCAIKWLSPPSAGGGADRYLKKIDDLQPHGEVGEGNRIPFPSTRLPAGDGTVARAGCSDWRYGARPRSESAGHAAAAVLLLKIQVCLVRWLLCVHMR